jgi:hypothetical protein
MWVFFFFVITSYRTINIRNIKMAVVAKRFSGMWESTNLPTFDLSTSGESGVLNAATNAVNDFMASAQALVSGESETPADAIEAALAEAERPTKPLVGSLQDIKKINLKEANKLVSSLLPNDPIVQNAFGKLSSSCKNKALKSKGLGKPFNPKLKCNGAKIKGASGDCSSGTISDILNKLSGGAYKNTVSDMNAILDNLKALSNFGYKANLCGVFGILGNGIPNTVLSKAMGGLMGDLSAAGNSLGLMDLSKSAPGLNPLSYLPGGVGAALSSFAIPSGFKENAFGGLATGFGGAMTLFKDKWDSSAFDNIGSIAEIGNVTEDLADVSTAGLMENGLDMDNLDFIPQDDSDFLSAATLCKADIADTVASTTNEYAHYVTDVTTVDGSFYDKATNTVTDLESGESYSHTGIFFADDDRPFK